MGLNTVGATQNDIADGADESDGRWRTLVDTGLTTTQPDRLNAFGSGASPMFADDYLGFFSSTDGDFGELSAVALGPNNGPNANTGSYLFKCSYLSPQANISTLTDNHTFGIVGNSDNPDQDNDIAIFRPTAGNKSSRNVFVDAGGTETTGSLNYPDIQNVHEYTLLIDAAGNYLSAGETGFYVDGDPREGDSPDVTLSATPNPTNNTFGFAYASEGSGHRLAADFIEVSVRL